jgi:hypothetical protein
MTTQMPERIEECFKETPSRSETLEQENRMLRTQLSTRKRQHDGILRSIDAIFANRKYQLAVGDYPIVQRPTDLSRPDQVPVMVLSDTQIGKNRGGYSVKECKRRVRNLAASQLRVLEVMSKGANIPYVEVWLGGDMVEGETIFPNQPYEIEEGVGDQACISAPTIMAEYILSFAKAGFEVKVRCIKGNHGRPGSKRDATSDSANWDIVSYHVTRHLIDAVKTPHMNITWPDGVTNHWYNVIELPGGWHAMLTHGDMISGGGTSATIEKKVSGWLQAIPEPFDYVVMGHFHRGIDWSVGNVEVIVNGTTETPEGDFLQGIVASTNRAFQRMLVFHEEHGLIDNKKFYLDDHTPRSQR